MRAFSAGLAIALCLALAPPTSSAQIADITATATASRKSIDLSESVRVIVVIEGPAPLRVELPKTLLAPETEQDWKIQPDGPAAITPAGPDRQRWTQAFRLDPYVFGNSMVILFSPMRVNGREIPGPSCEVSVEDPKIDTKPGSSMGVTGIEELPPRAGHPGSSLRWWWIPVVVALASFALIWRYRRRPRPLSPVEWVRQEFDRLERSGLAGAPLVHGSAAVVRGFIERRFGFPAPRLTTQELLAAVEQASWPATETEPLQQILEESDRVKFAGDVPDDEACRELLARSREWVHRVCPEPPTA
jgi:hypothetical protein